MPRTNLVPVRSRAGHIGAGVLAGAVGGLVVAVLIEQGALMPDLVTVLVFLALVTSPLLLVSLGLARTVPSWLTHLAAMFAGFGTLLVIALTAETLYQADGGASVRWFEVVEPVLVAAVFTVLGMVVSVAPWLAIRLVFGRPAPDDIRLCANCNYEYGAPCLNCPECGVVREPRSYRLRRGLAVSGWLHRWGWRLAVLTVGIVAAMFTWRFTQVTRPALAWHRALPSAVPVSSWSAFMFMGAETPSETSTVWLPHDDHPEGQGLIVTARIESGRISEAYIAVGVGYVIHGSTLTPPTPGSALIYARLNARDAQHILDRGLPRCVVDTLYREADGRGWSPQSRFVDRPVYIVDVSACFPPNAKPE